MTDEFDVMDVRQKLRGLSRDEASAAFTLSGWAISHVWELANQYWPDAPSYDDVRTPWWLFLTSIGPIRWGRRKRVIEIDWNACAFRGIVTVDDVTKSETIVHASARHLMRNEEAVLHEFQT